MAGPGQIVEAKGAQVETRGHGLSIFQKLLILTLSLIAVTVTLPAVYLPARQLAHMQVALEAKALTLARLVGKQVESAIAFDDRATAREVFDSVAQDPDVESLTLLLASGDVLHSRGNSTLAAGVVPSTLEAERLVTLGDRLRVSQPVVSLEGPRGTLVLEISTRALVANRREVHQNAVLACLLALLVGGAGAYWIARSLSRRLEAIASVAHAVARGQLEQPNLPEQGRDEIAVVSRAFNAMLRQLRELIGHMQERAEQEQRRLEQLVRDRTRELDVRNSDMRRVLDHVGQGFFTLGLDGVMSRERSAILERWLGAAAPSQHFDAYLRNTSGPVADWFELNWPSVIEGALPLELTLEQLPKRISVREGELDIEYRPITDDAGQLSRILVVISDRSAELNRQRAEADEREVTRMMTRLLADRAGFVEFTEEMQALLESIRSDADVAPLERGLHTFKGNAAMFGLDSLASLAHQLEDELCANESLAARGVEALTARWAELYAKVEPLIAGRAGRMEIEISEYEQVLQAFEGAESPSVIQRMLLDWRLEPTEGALARLAEHAKQLAERLGKGPILVQVDSGKLRLEPGEWRDFWSAAVHLVRNCVDHGLETPDERRQGGKPMPPRLSLSTAVRDGLFTIEVGDDGRGIDWEKVAARAESQHLPVVTQTDLLDALFASGMSTATTVSEISGRGVGLSVVRDACFQLGGSIDVASEPGRGTTFRFSWPAARIEQRRASAPVSRTTSTISTATADQITNRGTHRYGSQGK